MLSCRTGRLKDDRDELMWLLPPGVETFEAVYDLIGAIV